MEMQKEREAFEEWYENHKPVLLVENIVKGTARAAWQAAQAQAIPEGFVVVPKEPTQKMLNAGHVVMNPIKGSLVQAGTNQKRRDCYKAMIEAQVPSNEH